MVQEDTKNIPNNIIHLLFLSLLAYPRISYTDPDFLTGCIYTNNTDYEYIYY